ncbi:MAG: tetratricopeptide repeat protein [Candidatus Eremiobacteraeota bacterium]|nr:tetratricopeptide repeat protein [Candidatus Eremiobacteraeota bacterium]
MTPLLELLQMGKVHEARQQASARLLIQPNDPEALLALARMAAADADIEGADKLLQRAEASGQTSETRLTRAYLDAARQDHARAVEGFRKILAEQPERLDALFGLASALVYQEQFSEALPLWEKLTSLAPEEARYHYHLGRAYLELQRVEEAVDSLSRALTEDPSHVDSFLVLSRTLHGAGQPADAQEILEMGLKLMPEQNHLQNELTNLRLQRGDVAVLPHRSKAAGLARVRGKLQAALDLLSGS